MTNLRNQRLFSIILFLFLVLGVGPILLIAIFFAIPFEPAQFKISISLLLVLSTISTLCLAGLVTRLLKHPINKLLGGQKQIRHGNTQFRLSPKGNQELQLLFKGFNQMAEALEQASQKEQMLTEQRAFTKLASQVVHDLRSPLASLKTASDCLSQNETIPNNISKLIQMGTKRLEEIAEELLAHNKKISTELATLLHDAIDELIFGFDLQNRFPNLIIEKKYSSTPFQIKIGKKDMQRAVSNILTNAIEAMNGNGKITVKTFQKKDSIFLHIEDNGPGMTTTILEKVLKGGFTYNKANGNGIGMTVVREVVENNGGKLEALSTVGLGTTFLISFPQ